MGMAVLPAAADTSHAFRNRLHSGHDRLDVCAFRYSPRTVKQTDNPAPAGQLRSSYSVHECFLGIVIGSLTLPEMTSQRKSHRPLGDSGD